MKVLIFPDCMYGYQKFSAQFSLHWGRQFLQCICTLLLLGNIYQVFVFYHKFTVPGLLQLPGKRGDGPKGWAIQAKLDILIWLGLHKHKKDYLKDAPKGFQMVCHFSSFSVVYLFLLVIMVALMYGGEQD